MGKYVLKDLLMLAVARSPKEVLQRRQKLMVRLDVAAAKQLEPCEVFIGMSGMSNCVALQARKRHAAQVRIQRCSRHILSQQKILSQIKNAEQVSNFDVTRELQDYALADVIDVPAEHCRDSFIELGFEHDKLFCNHFGVDLSCFKPTVAPSGPPTFIMVGNWSLRKGCDVLLDAWRAIPGSRLLHVGPVGDFPLPTDSGFVHHDSVPQEELPKFYAQAHVMCLASREEGLAFVQPQALACGLPLVCTSHTGGADLRTCLKDSGDIYVVETGNVNAFRDAMKTAASECESSGVLRHRLLSVGRTELTWQSYTTRLLANIQCINKRT